MAAHVIPTPKHFEPAGSSVRLDFSWGLSNKGVERAVEEAYSIKLSLVPRPKTRNITLRKTTMTKGPEAYDLEIKPNSIVVSAQTDAGFLYALHTLMALRTGQDLPACMLNDWPTLAVRGILLDLSVLRELDVEGVVSLLEAACALKLNRVFLDYGDRFPYSMLDKDVPGQFTLEEIDRILRTAAGLELILVPVARTLGGLGFALKKREYAQLREPPGSDGRNDQICPSKPQSVELVRNMGEELIKAHHARFVHMGGAETNQLFVCEECRAQAQKEGEGSVFAEYMNNLYNSMVRRNRTAIIWDDIISRHPDALKKLDNKIMIMYRDFWTTKTEAPLVVARYARQGASEIAYDSRWRGEWKADLGDLENRILQSFADVHGEPKHLEESLGQEFLLKFRNYLGPNYPKYITAFPYIGFYKAAGFQVIGSPGALADVGRDLRHNLPHFERFLHNIKTFAQRVADEGQAGIVSAVLDDWPPETLFHGLIATAQFAWR